MSSDFFLTDTRERRVAFRSFPSTGWGGWFVDFLIFKIYEYYKYCILWLQHVQGAQKKHTRKCGHPLFLPVGWHEQGHRCRAPGRGFLLLPHAQVTTPTRSKLSSTTTTANLHQTLAPAPKAPFDNSTPLKKKKLKPRTKKHISHEFRHISSHPL